jgi:hypothetical protein
MLPIKIHKKLNNCRFITVAFYTVNTGYEKEVQNLLASMQGLDLSYEVWGIESLGSWQKNTQIKANFIKMMLLKYKQPVAYIDADNIFHRYPELYNIIGADFAAHYFKGTELASGVCFFNYTEATLRLVDEWIEENKNNSETWDQRTLQKIYEANIEIIFFPLPVSYAYFDLQEPMDNPVIEGFQASRRLKKEVNK